MGALLKERKIDGESPKKQKQDKNEYLKVEATTDEIVLTTKEVLRLGKSKRLPC
jgi:hypothetical protein